ncbi:hypothetical protein D3C73_1000410 [compost metagenome]
MPLRVKNYLALRRYQHNPAAWTVHFLLQQLFYAACIEFEEHGTVFLQRHRVLKHIHIAVRRCFPGGFPHEQRIVAHILPRLVPELFEPVLMCL